MFKDIAIHLTGSEEDATRISHSATIARSFDAHLTGLQVHEMPEVLAMTDPAGSAFLQELIAESVERAKTATSRLKAQFERIGLNHEMRRLDVYPGQVGHVLATEVRLSDLFVGTRPYGDSTKQHRVEEAVLFDSGRPCLFVPPHHPVPSAYGTIFVAWKNTREAARTLAEALPFLQNASSVIVGLVEEGIAGEQTGSAPGDDVGRYLSRHGIAAEIHLIDGWTDIPAALLNEAAKVNADMIVMGAYGHSRFREWVLSGATRHLLTNAPVPILVAH